LSARLYVQCSVEKIENGSFRVNTCDKKLPKSLVGILTKEKNSETGSIQCVSIQKVCISRNGKVCEANISLHIIASAGMAMYVNAKHILAYH